MIEQNDGDKEVLPVNRRGFMNDTKDAGNAAFAFLSTMRLNDKRSDIRSSTNNRNWCILPYNFLHLVDAQNNSIVNQQLNFLKISIITFHTFRIDNSNILPDIQSIIT